MNKLKQGEKMRKLRGGRTTREVAEKLGISESSYVKYERGERNPGDGIKAKIANFYGVTVQYIFFAD
jgi:transcriptional regulator with XRE-family HTH domain